MTVRSRAHRGAAALAVVLAFTAVAALEPAAAAPSDVLPPGTTVVIEDAAWSWFNDERAMFTTDGSQLVASAVAGTGSTNVLPGTVLLTELDVATGGRRIVDLGRAEPDDHNSASIHDTGSGELTTAWTRHHKDRSVRTQRRRTDGSWLRLPAIVGASPITYSNLRAVADATGAPVLYDFYRGARFDPEVLASADEGRTWSSLGRLLRDPLDNPSTRPYVQYSAERQGRIDLLATPSHPGAGQTAIYHGYIQAGQVHDSAGNVLGPLGSAVPVTSLTRVWAPSPGQRGWTADIVADPATGAPVAVFSSRISTSDHRYWWARWNGTAWQPEEVAYAGGALYGGEPDYTGLVALDPANPNRVVLSTNASPITGAPLVSATDGQRHWELWRGQRSSGGVWSWQPVTADSTLDNLRPVIANHPQGASALLWMRGTYTTYLDYDLDVVGVVTRANGTIVTAGPAVLTPATDVLPAPTPRSELARPVIGQLDGDPADDVLMARATGPDDLFLGDRFRRLTPIATPNAPTGVPVAGDYDGNGRDDIFWYGAGGAPDTLWSTAGVGTFTASSRPVQGTYTPVPGDYDGDGYDDILWYAPGAATDQLWSGSPQGLTPRGPTSVTGTYTPISGDFDGDGRDDIFWYAPGSTTDRLWSGAPGFAFSSTVPSQVQGTYTPLAGDYDGNGRDDIFWYAPGSAADSLWLAEPSGGFTPVATTPVRGSYRPIVGDLDGDGTADIQWYSTSMRDPLWWSEGGPLAQRGSAPVDL